MLNLLVLIPILAALAILFGAQARKTAFVSSLAQLGLTVLLLLSYQRGGSELFQFQYRVSVVPEWGLSYFLAVDGLSLLMLLLTSLVTAAAIWVAPKVEKRERLYYACLLFLSAGATGAFASQDLFFFYAFHELALIPTFLLIGLWGSGERHAAAWKITIYLALGSIVLLIGLIDLLQAIPVEARTFDMVELQNVAARHLIPASAQARPFLLLLIGFGTLVSLFPFHSWAPTAYASAPTPAVMLHAGVLKKFGLYGLIRIAVPLLPDGAKEWANLLLVLLVANILYIGLVTIAQKKLDFMLGYSSVMHMGYIFLGIASFNLIGLSGAALLMFAHGLSIAALFAIAGFIRERHLSLSFESLGGVAKTVPFVGMAFGMAAFASIGLPGFANFASEVMIFFGAFRSEGASLQFNPSQLAVIAGLWGVVISAVYMLRAYRAVFLGEPGKNVIGWTAPERSFRWGMILLIAALFLGGFAPTYFLSYLKPALEALLR